MLVKCTECNITYRLDDSLIKNTGSKVRCSQCKYIFTTFPDKKLLSTPPISSKPVNPLPPETVAISDESIEDSEFQFLQAKNHTIKKKRKKFDIYRDSYDSPSNSSSEINQTPSIHKVEKIVPNESESLEDQQKIEPEKNAIENKTDDEFQDVFENDSLDELLTAFCPDEFPSIEKSNEIIGLEEDAALNDQFIDKSKIRKTKTSHWKSFEFEPDEFEDNLNINEFEDVLVDTDITREHRAYQLAMDAVESHGWSKNEVKLLAQIFEQFGWTFTRQSIIAELETGMSFDEFKLAVEIREIWKANPEFSIGFSLYKSHGDYSSCLHSIYVNVNWSFCMKIIRSFNSLPDPAEIDQHFLRLYTEWEQYQSKQQRYFSFYSFILTLLDQENISFDMLTCDYTNMPGVEKGFDVDITFFQSMGNDFYY